MGTTNTLDLNNRISALEKGGGGGTSDGASRADIATEFDATKNYTAGCFVYYEGKLYQFNTDHAAGAWDPTDVVLANVTDQIVSNKSAIDGLTASDVAYDNTDSGLTATDVQGAIDELRQADNIMMSDGVTSVEDALDEVAERIDAHVLNNTYVTLSFQTEYIVPNDGYLCGVCNNGVSKYVDLQIKTSTGEWITMARGGGIQTNNDIEAIFVKKGMHVRLFGSASTDVSCQYYPIITE